MFYVYGLSCLCEKCETRGTTHIRYVGFTSRNVRTRLREHFKDKAWTPKSSWISAHGSENIKCDILAECESLAEAIQQEVAFIEKLDTYLPDSAVGGLNLTLGGDGVVGRVASDAERIRSAETSSSRWRAMDEYELAEHRKKISDGNKRAWKDLSLEEYEERCAAMSEGKRRAKEKRTAVQSEQEFAERSARSRAWWASLTDEERAAHVKKIGDATRRRVYSDEEKARQRERGLRVAHNRWHIKRGIISEDCPLCAAS